MPQRKQDWTNRIAIGTAPAAESNSKAEVSYAYLHALAATAGFACSCENGLPDGSGIMARLDIREQLDPQSLLQEFSLEIQLRTASAPLPIVNSKVAFSLEVDLYDRLRGTTEGAPRFMALLCLPEEAESGPTLSTEDLMKRRCARWVCLRGAPETSSTREMTVRVPVWNLLTPEALREIARRVSLGGRFFHEQ
ncbi:MAG: hypothetical protein JWN85_4823 [Gammaproteobacteria bacterium]|nr:hypothetical protein [Gammaproteobacteria bacterium]